MILFEWNVFTLMVYFYYDFLAAKYFLMVTNDDVYYVYYSNVPNVGIGHYHLVCFCRQKQKYCCPENFNRLGGVQS